MNEKVWRLRRSDAIVADIHVNDSDFPWLRGRLTARAGFDDVAPLFARELALIQADSEADWALWEEVYQRIRDQVTPVTPDGTPVAEFLLHIDGDEAWFRWSDTSFDQQ